MAIAVLGGGCFWCVEAVYKDLEGVSAVLSGYAGGRTETPSYEAVCTGTTGHAEVVRVTYDPSVLRYADLLRIFFTIHDPTTLNRQGNDVGTQYRSVIFVDGDEERRTANAVRDEIAAASVWDAPIVTEIAPLLAFYPAEPEHHDYFARHPGAGYCRVVIAPKVAKFRSTFHDRLKQGAA
ncbi:peptide-methionine (S)-S-oxide reductase MsrA [Lichenicoccus sp.]|uniref:peptide-methionine (S)-S-oxide reductase MsrA n=1 Tax=Lichenicoccus sp. TaxID=2781899 RepID=UPI003D103D24